VENCLQRCLRFGWPRIWIPDLTVLAHDAHALTVQPSRQWSKKLASHKTLFHERAQVAVHYDFKNCCVKEWWATIAQATMGVVTPSLITQARTAWSFCQSYVRLVRRNLRFSFFKYCLSYNIVLFKNIAESYTV